MKPHLRRAPGKLSHATPSLSPSSRCGSLAGAPAASYKTCASVQVAKSPQFRSGPAGRGREGADIEVADHVVVARDGWVSLKERGLGFERPS